MGFESGSARFVRLVGNRLFLCFFVFFFFTLFGLDLFNPFCRRVFSVFCHFTLSKLGFSYLGKRFEFRFYS